MMTKIPKYQLYECDVCATVVRKRLTRIQNGLRKCPDCIDIIPKERPLDLGFGTPRANDDTTTAVETPTVFSITAAGGITPSHSLDSETTQRPSLGIDSVPDNVFFGTHFYMQVIGSPGAVDITANPQISATVKGDVLIIEGTSDSSTVKLDDGNGVQLSNGLSFTLGDGDVIGLTYDGSNWIENFRHETGWR